MKYTKPSLTFAEQADLLLNRGLEGIDRDSLIAFLSRVNYYRLSAYFFPFKDYKNDERFEPNTTFEKIWRRYLFDQELRHRLVVEIETIEIAILRTQMVEQFTVLHGPFGYVDIACYAPTFYEANFEKLLDDIDDAVSRSKEQFVEHYQTVYTEETDLPLWMTAELLSFGSLYTIFHNLNVDEKKSLASRYQLFSPVLDTWLHTLNYVRNACAHHCRLWNRKLPIEPELPSQKHKPEWYIPVRIKNTRIFCVMTIIQYLLGYIEPGSDRFRTSIQQLLAEYPDIPLGGMGIPENWSECPIWN
jgi:abortive infection bacteriophage resistance protein